MTGDLFDVPGAKPKAVAPEGDTTPIVNEKVEFFEFLDILFTDKKRFAGLSDKDKKTHFFMTNRRFAVAFPLQAQAANGLLLDTVGVSHQYHHVFCTGKKPSWVYTKSGKGSFVKAADAKCANECLSFDKGIIGLWLTANDEADLKTFRDYVMYDPKRILNELKTILKRTVNPISKK